MFAFILLVLSCVGSDFAMGSSPVQGVLRLSTHIRLRNRIETKCFINALCSKEGNRK
jgi:hypothetical protein